MDKEVISVSFVAVFSKILPNVPALENKFCRDLFGMPYDTFNGVTQEGYVIAVENKPMPSITITPQKIVFKAKTVDELAKYVNAIAREFASKSIPMAYSAFGVNSEYQWINLPETAGRWIWQHFINPTLGNGESNQCNSISLRFGINESEHLNMEFLPRIGRHDGVFASINHHHSIGGNELPNHEVLAKLFKDTTVLIDEQFRNIIGIEQ